jgi:hypothetical protein
LLIMSATLDARPTRIGAEYLGLARDFRRQVKGGDKAHGAITEPLRSPNANWSRNGTRG